MAALGSNTHFLPDYWERLGRNVGPVAEDEEQRKEIF